MVTPTASTPAERIHQLETENAALQQALARHVPLDQLEAVERDLRSILDHMPSMIGYWDRNLRNRFGNRAYFDWFGVDPASMPGKHISEVIGAERYRLNLPYIEAALRGEAQEFERAIPTPDGKQIRHSLANYIPDCIDGTVRGFYVLVTDITAIKEAEAALQAHEESLRASEERYRAVVEDQTEVISRFRQDGTFAFVNEVYCRFFGKTAEELLGRQWMPICFPDDLPRVNEELSKLAPNNPVVTIENRIYSGSGALHWMQFVNRGFFDATGQLVEIQSVGRDITKSKQAEAALNEAHELLERRVSERTEQLRRLAVETTLAEERERQAIARDLHDELGQILHVIRIRLDALEKHLPASASGEIRQLNDLLDDASRQVRSLTAQLCPPVLKRLGLTAALRWLADEMNRQYGLMVSFTNETPSLPMPLSPAQSDILFRAARELLINVAKHAGTQQARLALTWHNGQLNLTVADDGIGIADAAALAERPEGFGLSSIRERIAYLGGTTTIAPSPAGGLCVALHLPLTQPPATPETP